MFETVGELNLIPLEHKVLEFWEKEDVFNKLREKNSGGKPFSFIDGPITANNPMGVHHAWGRVYKDIFHRYQAMQGRKLRYQNGYDCQGLWVEVEVEKQLGFTSKRDIEAYGIDKFVNQCKERVLKYSSIQTEQSKRLGYWMDWDNSYYTMSDENNYMIWHFLRKCHDHGWIYKGRDVMPWCPRCGTALSEHEIVTEGYKEITHPSVFLKFPLLDQENSYLLVWTTTPWTLTSNTAAAVNPQFTYAKVQQGDEYYYLIKDRLSILTGPYTVKEELLGNKMLGWRYKGPFDELPPQDGVIHRVIEWDMVTTDEGTGIVHIAPGCGKEDFGLSSIFNLSVIAPLDENGYFVEGFGFLTGLHASKAAQVIFANLREKGILYKLEDYLHRYPVCWRCDSELLFRLVDEWFIKMDELRYKIMDVTKRITWLPEFGQSQELDWLTNMHDWCISKKRYWGLALPIYDCKCGHFTVIGSETELKERAVEGWEEFDGNSPHRPWIDNVKIRCEKCGEIVSRIKDVGNPWLDAGIVPYSTLNYRHDRSYWETWFPSDFITECFPGQFRNWFYSLLAMSTVLEDREPFKLVLGHALIKDEKGDDMHKSKGNAIWFDDAAEKMGVEAMRYLFAAHSPFTNINFGYALADPIKRNFLTLWNSYTFFVTYAILDNYTPSEKIPPQERSDIDRWILSKLNLLVKKTIASIEKYDLSAVIKLADMFIDDLSNWYIRRCRSRFWKSENDGDKKAAYDTLYEVLETLIRLLAPIFPFMTEEIYQNLVRSVQKDVPISIHLCTYPTADESLINLRLEKHTEAIQKIVSLGRSARNQATLKVRQPLSEIIIVTEDEDLRNNLGYLQNHIIEEINIKNVVFQADSEGLLSYKVKPNFKVVGTKYKKDVPMIKSALEKLSSSYIKENMLNKDEFAISVEDGREIVMAKEDVEIYTESKENYSVGCEGNFVVAVNTQLNEQLIREGIAREIVRKIQDLRKKINFMIADRIDISYQINQDLEATITEFSSYIKAETLCINLKGSTELPANYTTLDINGKPLHLALSLAAVSQLV